MCHAHFYAHVRNSTIIIVFILELLTGPLLVCYLSLSVLSSSKVCDMAVTAVQIGGLSRGLTFNVYERGRIWFSVAAIDM